LFDGLLEHVVFYLRQRSWQVKVLDVQLGTLCLGTTPALPPHHPDEKGAPAASSRDRGT